MEKLLPLKVSIHLNSTASNTSVFMNRASFARGSMLSSLQLVLFHVLAVK